MTNQPLKVSFLAVGTAPDLHQSVQRVLAAPGFCGEACTHPDHALHKLSRKEFDVMLCELNLPGMGSLALVEEVRRRFPNVGVVAITSSEDADQALLATQAGAADYLSRPLRPSILIVSIHRAAAMCRMERELKRHRSDFTDEIVQRMDQSQRGLERIERTWEETVGALGHALGLRDNETAEHCQRVTRYSIELARALDCSADDIMTITRGAYLHDLGKIGIPDAILHKPGALTPEERAVMEKHVQIGHEMVHRISFLAPAAEIVLTHHERFDGTGYPQGLKGHEIPLGGRIFALADSLDAMTSDRPYRKAQGYSAAREEIVRESGRQFDPEVVEAFLSVPLERWQEIREQIEQRPQSHGQDRCGDVQFSAPCKA